MTRFSARLSLLILTAGALLGCAGSGGSSTGTPADASSQAATTVERYGKVPPAADRGAAGYARQTFRAPADGRVWVGNEARRYVVITHLVVRGDVIEVIPERDRVELNNQPIYTENLEKNDEHCIYFLPGNTWDGHAGGEIHPYDAIPKHAASVATGMGHVEWRAEHSGRVWIGNDKLKKNIVSHDVRTGDVVEIDVSHDQVKINGRVIYSQNLESKHQHSIFFR